MKEEYTEVKKKIAHYINKNKEISMHDRALDQEWFAAWRSSIASMSMKKKAEYKKIESETRETVEKITEVRIIAKATDEYKEWQELMMLTESIDRLIDSMKHTNKVFIEELKQ